MTVQTNCTVQTEHTLSQMHAFNSGIGIAFEKYARSILNSDLTANAICRTLEVRLKEIDASREEMLRILNDASQKELRFNPLP